MRIRSTSKPDTRAAESDEHTSSVYLVAILTLISLALLIGYANAGETVSTNSETVTLEKSAAISPNVKEHLCGGCSGYEGLTAEYWMEGDICLERDDVRLFIGARKPGNLQETTPGASKSEFVLLVYMVDYLFRNGEHLSNENLAMLANQDMCAEINIDCLTQTVNRVFDVHISTVE